MGADTVVVKLNGIGELKRALAALPEKLRRKALLGPMKKAMRVVRDAARQAAPALETPSPYRTKGTLKRRLSVRVSKISRKAGDVGVFVNVRPLPRSERSARNPKDPFYWNIVRVGSKKHLIVPKTARALHFGNLYLRRVSHPGMRGVDYLEQAAGELSEAKAIFEREVIPEIEKLNQRGA